MAIAVAIAIALCVTYIYTIGMRPLDDMTPVQRMIDMFCRAFTGAAWSSYSNYASKAVVEVAFASVVDRSSEDWRKPALYLLAADMISTLVQQEKFLNMG